MVVLFWYKDFQLDILWVDIVIVCIEFYFYLVVNLEVEVSFICQDLYWWDFIINVFFICLINFNLGKLLDFFGGMNDL